MSCWEGATEPDLSVYAYVQRSRVPEVMTCIWATPGGERGTMEGWQRDRSYAVRDEDRPLGGWGADGELGGMWQDIGYQEASGVVDGSGQRRTAR